MSYVELASLRPTLESRSLFTSIISTQSLPSLPSSPPSPLFSSPLPLLRLQACKLMLKIESPHSGEKGYNALCHSLVVLMSCGMEYSRQRDELKERVTSACASHQCFSLCMGLLTQLPPCYSVLTSAVDGSGISIKVRKEAS